MLQEYESLIQSISSKEGERKFCRKQVREFKGRIDVLNRRIRTIDKCVYILQLVIASRQNTLVDLFNTTVTSALQDLFGEDYEFKIVFGKRNAVSKCDFMIHTGEYKGFLPLEMCQGKALKEIVAIIMQIIFISALDGEDLLVSDESLSGLEVDKQWQAGMLLKKIANSFNLQIIMVSHLQPVIDSADNKIDLD